MSRNAIIITLIIVFIGYGATILYLGPEPLSEPLKPEVNITEPMGLSVISLGEEISVPNETTLIKKLEQFAEENYPNWVATLSIGYQEYRDRGTVITMKYQTPINLTWVWAIGGISPDQISVHQISVQKISAALSHDHQSLHDDWVIVYAVNGDRFPLEIPREQADELLNLLGIEIPADLAA